MTVNSLQFASLRSGNGSSADEARRAAAERPSRDTMNGNEAVDSVIQPVRLGNHHDALSTGDEPQAPAGGGL